REFLSRGHLVPALDLATRVLPAGLHEAGATARDNAHQPLQALDTGGELQDMLEDRHHFRAELRRQEVLDRRDAIGALRPQSLDLLRLQRLDVLELADLLLGVLADELFEARLIETQLMRDL